MSFRALIRRPWLFLAVLAAFLLTLTPPLHQARAATATLMVSAHPDRSAAMALSAAPQAGLLYIFAAADSGASKVSFYLDDPNRAKAPYHVETWAPFTFAGDTAAGSNPWDSKTVLDGQHTITAAVVVGGVTQVVTSTFTVSNLVTPPPAPSPYALKVSAHADRSAPVALAGATLSGTQYVFLPQATGVTRVVFWLDDATRAGALYQTESSAPWDFRGGATAAANPWSTSSLSAGTHVISADVTTATGVSHIDASFAVAGGTSSGPVSYTYSPMAPVPTGTTEAESVTLNGKVYLFGGFDIHVSCCTSTNRAWVYDIAGNRWSALPNMPGPGISHAGIDSDGVRYIYYGAGYADDPAGIQGVNATTIGWRYDTVAGTYSALPDLPERLTAGGMAYVGGKLFYFGGNGVDRTVDFNHVWMLDVANNATSWVAKSPMPNARDHPGWGVINGKIYVVGGEHATDSWQVQADLDRYDPATDTWAVLAPLPFGRSHLMDSTFAADGKLYAIGGWTQSVVSDAVLVYDPATNAWTTRTSVPQARTSATAKPLGNGKFLFCCGSAGTSTSDGWIATPSS